MDASPSRAALLGLACALGTGSRGARAHECERVTQELVGTLKG